MEEYYVYAYLDPTEKFNKSFCDILFEYRPIYIGKGKNKRMFGHLNDRKRFKTMFYNKLNKMIVNNTPPIITKLKIFTDELESLEFEKLLIEEIKNIKDGGYLYNITVGGTGISGYRFSEESKNRRSERSIKDHIHLRFPNTSGENHPMFEKHHTEESLHKMSESKKGQIQSEETRLKRSNSMKGRKPSPQAIAASIKKHTGSKMSEESRQKMSKARIGKLPWNTGRIKDIILQIDLNGNIINEWDNLKKLKESGFEPSNVINCCSGRRKTHKNYIWKYKSIPTP